MNADKKYFNKMEKHKIYKKFGFGWQKKTNHENLQNKIFNRCLFLRRIPLLSHYLRQYILQLSNTMRKNLTICKKFKGVLLEV